MSSVGSDEEVVVERVGVVEDEKCSADLVFGGVFAEYTTSVAPGKEEQLEVQGQVDFEETESQELCCAW